MKSDHIAPLPLAKFLVMRNNQVMAVITAATMLIALDTRDRLFPLDAIVKAA